jgi:hypothetical protein
MHPDPLMGGKGSSPEPRSSPILRVRGGQQGQQAVMARTPEIKPWAGK